MRALIRFFLRSGVRLAVQSYTPLFSALIAWVILNMYPAALVRSIAASLFVQRPAATAVLPLALLAFLLPAWAALRLAAGLNGWMRHLPVSSAQLRRGLVLALAVVQAPLAGALIVLAVVAAGHRAPVAGPLLRYAVLLAAGGMSALPVGRRPVVFLLSSAAAGLAAFGTVNLLPLPVLILATCDAIAGPLRKTVRHLPTPSASALFEVRIAWRAVGWRVFRAFAAGMAAIGAVALFVSNNPMPRALQSATVRFGAGFAATVLLSLLAHDLAVRRPVWPWARSLPFSSGHRILSDALIVGIASLAPVLAAFFVDPPGAVAALQLLPFLSVRTAGHIRTIPERRNGSGVILGEGFAASAVLALFWWSPIVWLAVLLPAFRTACARETRQKVTRWLELHHTAAGDPMSWSG